MTESIRIDAVPGVTLDASVSTPARARGTIIFAHGSGSSRHSPRNQSVATTLNEAQLETVLMDLLTPEEEEVDVRTREHRFDIALLARRVAGVVDWAQRRPDPARLPIGLFGASTGAAAALVAAAHRRHAVEAVVSRGGRPDLAGQELENVTSPTLLIVGGDDHVVIDLNRQARARIAAEVELEIVPGAGHLFEEPGKLEAVAELASGWFTRHLAPERQQR